MRRLLTMTIAVLLGGLGAPAARAATTTATSSNWAGYAVSRSGIRYRRVSASWTVPTVSYTPGRQSFSANWIGLGGFRPNSQALEQIGTEANCSAAGRASYAAWYELVPATAAGVRLRVSPGDVMSASVTVVGHSVSLRLADDTHPAVYAKAAHAGVVDTSSAEWIVEAPSVCASSTVSSSNCQMVPLADFQTTHFGQASATSTTGHTGTISNPSWSATAIFLSSAGRRFGGAGISNASGQATPLALSASGSAFDVIYQSSSPGGGSLRSGPRRSGPLRAGTPG